MSLKDWFTSYATKQELSREASARADADTRNANDIAAEVVGRAAHDTMLTNNLSALVKRVLAAESRIAALEKPTPPDPAAGSLCGQYDSRAYSQYVVQNNVWGATTKQCIKPNPTGFEILEAEHNNHTDGAPASYPSIFWGVHYDTHPTIWTLPRKISDIKSLSTFATLTYPNDPAAIYDCAYDIWLDPQPKTTGQNAVEVMIWLNRQGPIQPIGTKQPDLQIGGVDYEVWAGDPGWKVYTFVAKSPVTALNGLPLLPFIPVDLTDYYLTSIQLGFELWKRGAGLAVNNFSVELS